MRFGFFALAPALRSFEAFPILLECVYSNCRQDGPFPLTNAEMLNRKWNEHFITFRISVTCWLWQSGKHASGNWLLKGFSPILFIFRLEEDVSVEANALYHSSASFKPARTVLTFHRVMFDGTRRYSYLQKIRRPNFKADSHVINLR